MGMGRRLASVALVVCVLAVAGWPVGAQPAGCVQPSPRGCPIALDQIVTAAVGRGGESHLWRLTVVGPQGLRVVLSGPIAGYTLDVSPDGAESLGSSVGGAAQDAVVEVGEAAPGDYLISVTAPDDLTAAGGYQLLVQRVFPVSPVAMPTAAAASEEPGTEPVTPTPTVRPTPTPAPTRTPEPPREPQPFGPIRFGTDVVNRALVGEGTRFPSGTVRLIGYAPHTGEEPPAGTPFGDVWRRNGELYLDNRDAYTWSEGLYDYFAFTLTLERNVPLRPGSYELSIYLDGREVQRATCVVE